MSIPTGQGRQGVAAPHDAERAEPFPEAPPPGFFIYERYNGLQLAFMRLMRFILRRERFYGWPPSDD